MQARLNRVCDATAATVRHLSTLAAGTVVVMAGFLAQSTTTYHWPGALAVAFVAMLASILCLSVAQFNLLNASVISADEDRPKRLKTAKRHAAWVDRFVGLGLFGLVLGLLCIGAFGVANI